MTTSERNKLVLNYLNLAKKLAFNKRRAITSVPYDELEAAAFYGLVDAASKYNPEINNNFMSYASMRIIGAIKDYLRELWDATEIDFDIEEKSRKEDNFSEIIKVLPQNDRNILHDYYVMELPMKVIGNSMGLTESGISRRLSNIHQELRTIWKTKERIYELN